jgi:hypothetical protein
MNRSNGSKLRYPLVKNKPVAQFYYEGHHSHPVRRTVLVTESDNSLIKGYELREGTVVRNLSGAPIKSYRRDKIAMIGQCGRRLRKRLPKKQHTNSTLKRVELLEALMGGI